MKTVKRLVGIALFLVLTFTPFSTVEGQQLVELYYITEYIQMWVVGDGTYSLTDPGTTGRQVNASSVLLTGNWNTPAGKKTSAIIPVSTKGRSKDTALVWVLTEASHHTAIQLDSRNVLVPFAPDDLDNLYSSLSAQDQNNLEGYLTTVFMDSDWITQATPLREIISYFIHVILSGQQLGPDYPDRSLTSRWNSYSEGEQTAINDLLTDEGLTAISSNVTTRVVVNELAQISFGVLRFGNQQFNDWSP